MMSQDFDRRRKISGFSGEVARFEEQVTGLLSFDMEAGETARLETTEALRNALEELRVAEEELGVQNAELEKALAAVEEQRSHYADLFESAPDAYLITDLPGKILEANHAAYLMMGFEPPYLRGKPLVSYIELEAGTTFRTLLGQLARSGHEWAGTMRLRSRQRDLPVEVDASALAIWGKDGQMTALRWVFRDVTTERNALRDLRRLNAELERRVAERTSELETQLREQERLLIEAHAEAASGLPARRIFHLVQGLDAIVWEADAETGSYTFVNQRAEELLGFPVSFWKANPHFWVDRLHPDDCEWAIRNRRHQLEQARDHEAEYRLVAADGRSIWFRESVRIVPDADGSPRELRGLMVNISRRKKIERQLYTAKRELSRDLDDLSHLHELSGRLSQSGLDLEAVLREILQAATSLQGTDKGAVLLYNPERDDLTIAASTGLPEAFVGRIGRVGRDQGACGRVLTSGQRVIVENVNNDPGHVPFLEAIRLGGFQAIFSQPLFTRSGEFVGTIATMFDEPHRPPDRHLRLVELYACQAADMIDNARLHGRVQHAERAKEELLATVVHELRNPLSALLNAAQLQEVEDADPEARQRYREIILRQSQRIAGMVDELLDSTRARLGKIELHRKPTDLSEIVFQAIEATGPLIESRGHSLSVSMGSGPLRLMADPGRLEQVIVNLLTNAAKYTESGGSIALSAAQVGAELVLRVRDSGIGMTPELLDRVFEIYHQAGPTQDRPRDGLGLGLSLVRRLVELHGGTVHALSNGPGQGSEFVVRLPSGFDPQARSPDQRRQVLIVDDDAESATLVARLIRSRGHDATVAHDGEAALKAFAARRPDVVVLDLELPGIDGVEIARQIRQQPENQPFLLIALSGHSEDHDRQRISEAGFDFYLTKPLDFSLLLTQFEPNRQVNRTEIGKKLS
ncbi:hypothetical protein BH23PLA1_BH23PLA1_17000 [soil metagenome]